MSLETPPLQQYSERFFCGYWLATDEHVLSQDEASVHVYSGRQPRPGGTSLKFRYQLRPSIDLMLQDQVIEENYIK